MLRDTSTWVWEEGQQLLALVAMRFIPSDLRDCG
jgi:hypothetical protein